MAEKEAVPAGGLELCLAQIVPQQTTPATLQTTGAFVGPRKGEEELEAGAESYALRPENASTVGGFVVETAGAQALLVVMSASDSLAPTVGLE